jgi:hypothetical protein
MDKVQKHNSFKCRFVAELRLVYFRLCRVEILRVEVMVLSQHLETKHSEVELGRVLKQWILLEPW